MLPLASASTMALPIILTLLVGRSEATRFITCSIASRAGPSIDTRCFRLASRFAVASASAFFSASIRLRSLCAASSASFLAFASAAILSRSTFSAAAILSLSALARASFLLLLRFPGALVSFFLLALNALPFLFGLLLLGLHAGRFRLRPHAGLLLGGKTRFLRSFGFYLVLMLALLAFLFLLAVAGQLGLLGIVFLALQDCGGDGVAGGFSGLLRLDRKLLPVGLVYQQFLKPFVHQVQGSGLPVER